MAMSEAELALYWEDLKLRVQRLGLQLSCTPNGLIQIKRGQALLFESTVFIEVEAWLKGWEARKP